jgi:hypothetical protein
MEDGVAAAFGFGEDAGLNRDVGVFLGPEKKAVGFEWSAGKFEASVTGVFLHGELTVDNHKVVGHGADLGFLEIILVEHFGVKRGGE